MYNLFMGKEEVRRYLLRYLNAFILGALLLSAFSRYQKKLLGLPLTFAPSAFVIPVFFGGFSGLFVSIFYIRLRASREQMRDFLNNADDIIQIIDQEGNFLFVNKAWHKKFGYTSLEVKSLNVFDIIHPTQVEKCQIVIQKLFEGDGHSLETDTIYLSKDGETIYLEGKLNCRFDKGRAISTRGIFRDITERHEAREFQKLVGNIFEKTREGLVITDPKQAITFINAAFTKITGYTKEEAIGKNIHKLFPNNKGVKKNMKEVETSLEENDYWQYKIWTRRKNGEEYLNNMTILRISISNEDVSAYACLFSDITEKEEKDNRLRYLATHDILTDLHNRDIFYQHTNRSLVEAKEKKNLVAVLFLDLDGFKDINDQYGHHAGDALLKLIAQRLRHHTREEDSVARLGGDEFAILLSKVSSENEVKAVAQNILNAIAAPFNLGDFTIQITTSIGISIYSENSEIGMLIAEADQAMYKAKREGKNRISILQEEDTRPIPMDVGRRPPRHP